MKELVCGAWRHRNYKKIELSRAYFKNRLVTADTLPTPRAVAAYQFLKKNKFYQNVLGEQRSRLQSGASLNISSPGLFINMKGIEAAIFPVLCPTADFTDTCLISHNISNGLGCRSVMSGFRGS